MKNFLKNVKIEVENINEKYQNRSNNQTQKKSF